MKKQKAFTLIELMIVMAIIAILATAGLAAYSGYIKKSRDTARAEIASNLNTAVMSYAASNGGNPPADQNAFESFLASAGEVFSGSGVTGTTLVEDPVGGKEVCLDAQGNATEPCSFNYTAYDDGTYAISYGVEDKSSAEGNFYKTTRSVLDENSAPKDKYGVYLGSAPFIGSPPTTSITEVADGVDVSYTPVGGTVPIPMADVDFATTRIDRSTVISGGESVACPSPCPTGETCNTTNGTCMCGSSPTCVGGWICASGICADPDPCLRPDAVAGDTCLDTTVFVTSTLRTTRYDEGVQTYSSAAAVCNGLWSGWRLPLYTELENYLYVYRELIQNFDIDNINDGGSGDSRYIWVTGGSWFWGYWVFDFYLGTAGAGSNMYGFRFRCIRNV